MSQFPSLPEITETTFDRERNPEVMDLADGRTGELLGALKSGTARQLLRQLRRSPTYPSKLADQVDTTVQNVHYHLGKLEDAGAVEIVDSVYSEKGREMNVYAPTAEPLVIVSGSDDDRQQVVEALSEVLGAIGVLALGSIAVQELVDHLLYPGGPETLSSDVGRYAVAPLTNVAPPVGLYVFFAGLVALSAWVAWHRW